MSSTAVDPVARTFFFVGVDWEDIGAPDILCFAYPKVLCLTYCLCACVLSVFIRISAVRFLCRAKTPIREVFAFQITGWPIPPVRLFDSGDKNKELDMGLEWSLLNSRVSLLLLHAHFFSRSRKSFRLDALSALALRKAPEVILVKIDRVEDY